MSSTRDFNRQSYSSHVRHLHKYARGGDREKQALTWFATDTVNAWRLTRVFSLLDPVLEAYPNVSWLTVGDGRFGSDAKYIQDKGFAVLATDISESLLKEAKESGYINDFRVENAESLSFKDDEFDFVLCKDSFHHFPRPMVALYEMLRVSKKGVVLIEPNDRYFFSAFTECFFRNFVDSTMRLLGRPVNKHSFEESGNYIYTISRREIEKVALGMNYRFVAFKGINDYFVSGAEHEKLSDKGKLYRKTCTIIRLLDLLVAFKLRQHRLLSAILFKEPPSDTIIDKLRSNKYKIVELPMNPYL